MEQPFFHNDFVSSNRIIYTPSDFAKMNLIHLQETGELTAQKPHTCQRQNLSSYLFFIVLKGTGTIEYNGYSHTLHQGSCVFIDCQKPYSHKTSQELWTLKWVHFYGPNMHGIYEKYVERGGLSYFKSSKFDIYNQLLTQIYSIATSDSFIKDMQLFEKLTSLLTLLMEESWNPDIKQKLSSHKRNLQLVKEYLDQHYSEKIALDSLSRQFYISKYYMTRLFKEQFGISINNYILHLRINHAKQLLRFTDLSIEKIGQECGMNDANYFSRVFRRIEKMSPGKYRKIW